MKNETHKDNDVLAQLLVQAPARPQPRAQAKDEAFRALHAQWSGQVATRRQHHRWAAIAVAATVVLGLGTMFMLGQNPSSMVQVAVIERVLGPAPVVIDGHGNSSSMDVTAATLMTGQTLATGPNTRVAVAWHDGGSLRLDVNSRVEWLSPTDVQLLEGALYFDSGDKRNAAHNSPILNVRTSVGVATHLGTQYLIEQLDDEVVFSVREGRISLRDQESKSTVEAGLQVRRSSHGTASSQRIASYAKPWQWVARTAPPFSVQPASTAVELIDWIARETGRSVVYVSGAKAQALATPLVNFGTLSASSSTIDVLQSATNLEFDVTDEQILVSVRTASR